MIVHNPIGQKVRQAVSCFHGPSTAAHLNDNVPTGIAWVRINEANSNLAALITLVTHLNGALRHSNRQGVRDISDDRVGGRVAVEHQVGIFTLLRSEFMIGYDLLLDAPKPHRPTPRPLLRRPSQRL